ncbi:uncharacterized protein LOC100879817 [Megachile rotundata]|uniref:uncharacterized protein LOC100879817 n=1 Tax=Megachile rotundata TaxID=143995 RepID=UPI000614F4D1|nr:PREDICTED: uncharacterized protein LOC100879817 [Megachile rotundata]
MAGIFNLFGESNLNKGQVVKPLVRSKTTIGASETPVKTVLSSKQKGLSIRTNSNSNISTVGHLTNLNQDVPNKPQEYLKPKLTQLDIGGRPISPGKDLKADEYSTKSLKKVPDKKNTQKLSDKTIFLKPALPKNYTKKRYPEPESLAPYCDMQFEFDDIYSKTIENEFKELLLKKRDEVLPYNDSFETDPEEIEYEMPTLYVSPISFDTEWRQFKIPSLPEISDNEDYF